MTPFPLCAGLLAAVAGCAAGGAFALDTADPFAIGSATPPPPRLDVPAMPSFEPCRPATTDIIYGVLEVVDRALCRNPTTREAWANARVQAELAGVAEAAFLPDLDGRVTANRNRTDGVTTDQGSAALTLSWLLYDFGARAANLENARQLLRAATQTLDATVHTVFLAALQAYYTAQAARAAVEATIESERAARESLTAAETRYRVGTGTPADRLQAQTAWSQATLARIRAEGTLRTAQGTLANVMGFDANVPLRLDTLGDIPPAPRRGGDVDALIAEARERRPELRAAEAQVAAAGAGVDAARAAGKPTLSLGTGPTWQHFSGNDGGTTRGNAIGLTLSIPFFSGYETTYRVRAAQARVEASLAQRDNTRLQVALEVWTAYQELATANQALNATSDLLASAEQSARVALGRYKAGVGTVLDLLNAQSALAAARQQRIQAAFDWHVARATLARAVGTLDAGLLSPAPKTPNPVPTP